MVYKGNNGRIRRTLQFIRANAELEGIGQTFKWFCKEITRKIAEHSSPEHDKESIMFCVVRAIAPHYFEYND